MLSKLTLVPLVAPFDTSVPLISLDVFAYVTFPLATVAPLVVVAFQLNV